MATEPDATVTIASTSHLNAYYGLILSGACGHFCLLLFTLGSRRVHKQGVLINFYFIFMITLWFDSILCWTNNMYNPEPPKSIQIINVVIRKSGMCMNAASTLACVIRFWVSTNIAASTRVSSYLHIIDNSGLVIFPYIIGIPFFIAYLVFLIRDTSLVHRTPFYCDSFHVGLDVASTIVALIIMVFVVILAFWLTGLLVRLRATQRGLVRVKWSVNLQLTARILLFFFYSCTSVTLHVWNLYRFPGYRVSPTLVFASTGLVAFMLFLIQADILAALGHYMGFERKKKLPIQNSSDKDQRCSGIEGPDYQMSLDAIFPQLPSPVRKDQHQDYAELESLENIYAQSLNHTHTSNNAAHQSI